MAQDRADDTGGDATKALQLANKLLITEHVAAIVCPSITGETMAVMPKKNRSR